MRKALLFGVLLLFGFAALQFGLGLLMWGAAGAATVFGIVGVLFFAAAAWLLSEEQPARVNNHYSLDVRTMTDDQLQAAMTALASRGNGAR